MSLFLACFFSLLIPFSISVGLTPEVRESTNINNFPTSALLTNLSNMTRRGRGWKGLGLEGGGEEGREWGGESESEKGKEEKGAEVGGGGQDRVGPVSTNLQGGVSRT